MSLVDCLPPFLFALVVLVFGCVMVVIRERRQPPRTEPHTQPLPAVAVLSEEDRAMLSILRARPAVVRDGELVRTGRIPQESEGEG